MNLLEAMDAALPELPAKRAVESYPRLDRRLIAQEHVEEGVPKVLALIPGGDCMFRIPPNVWTILLLFDGKRSYAEIAEEATALTGLGYSEAEVRELASRVEENGMFDKPPGEATISRTQDRDKKRRKLRKVEFGDFTEITFPAWNPDPFLTWLYPKVKWVYTPWFTAVTLVLFAFMTYVFVDRWSEIWEDTIQFYTFTTKSFYDIVDFWILFLVLICVHEVAHGLTTKHFGGNVPRMGFILMYLFPAFFTDTSQSYIYGGRWQRLATMGAGIWVEMIICALATIVWWGTAPGSFTHGAAYKIMLINGIMVPLINLNPLIKLDGYFIFSEILGVHELKERSTAFVSAWARKHIYHLPVEVPFVPRNRKPLFVAYALVSGAYSYTLLFVLSRFVYNVAYSYTPEWAFLPAAGAAYLVYKARARNLVRFMKTLYLDKRERVRAWLTPGHALALAAAGLAFMMAPLWKETVEGRFLLEPAQRAVVRAMVPGQVVDVLADEGDRVSAGAPLVRLRNLSLASETERSRAELGLATARAAQAQLRYVGYGPAAEEERQRAQQLRGLSQQMAMLEVTSPIAGVVTTPRVRDRLGSNLAPGTEIAEIADLSTLRARIYVPEFAVRKIQAEAPVRLRMDAFFGSREATVESLAPVSADLESGLAPKVDYRGLRPPRHYVVTIVAPNADGSLRDGMAGTASIHVGRRSLAGFACQAVREFFQRKLW